MRRTLALGTALSLVVGCNGSAAPAPTSEPAATLGALVTPMQTATAVTPRAPVSIVYARLVASEPRQVAAILEDGSRPAARLSRPGVDSTFAGVLSGDRVLVAAHSEDASLVAIDLVSADGSGRRELGALRKGLYSKVIRAEADGEVAVVELARVGAPATSDVVALRAGSAPVTLGQAATLVTVAAGRVALLAGGTVKSVKLDGSEVRVLGGADRQDKVIEVRGSRVLLTLHASGAGDVRIADLDGSHVDIGTAGIDERAVGFAGDAQVVLTRAANGKRQIVAVGLDGKGERALSPADADAAPASLAPNGDVLYIKTTGELALAPLSGGQHRVLDAAPGAQARVAKIVGDRAFSVGIGPAGGLLRTSKLDGSGATELCNEPLWTPFFSAATGDGRVLFYRALAGRPDGGQLYSVRLDGGDLQPIGSSTRDADGTALGPPRDQDFEAVTPSGRIVLEAELQGTASHLFVSAGGADARRISDREHAKFAALTRP